MDSVRPMLDVRHLKKDFQLHLVDGRLIEPFSDISFCVGKSIAARTSAGCNGGATRQVRCEP